MPSTYFVHVQLTRDLFAIAKFLVRFISQGNVRAYFVYVEQDYTCDSEVKSWNRTATFTSPRRRLCYCHSIILFVWRISVKVISRFRWNLMLWLDVYLTCRKNWLTFGGSRIPDTDSGSFFHCCYHCEAGDFRRFISISHLQSPPIWGHSAKWLTLTTQWIHILGAIWQTSGSEFGLIRKSGFESRIICGWG